MKNLIFAMLMTLGLASCTLSFQNIDTHGTATDLVDENQATSPNVSPSFSLPLDPL
jgi:hypothetical protein